MMFDIFDERKFPTEINIEHCPISFKHGHTGSECHNSAHCRSVYHETKECPTRNRDDKKWFEKNKERGYGPTSGPAASVQNQTTHGLHPGTTYD